MPRWRMHTNRTGRRTLTIRVRWADEARPLESLVHHPTQDSYMLLPRLVSEHTGRYVRLHYDVGELLSLDEVLRTGSWDMAALAIMLDDIVAALRYLGQSGTRGLCVCYDAHYVFVDYRFHLHFVVTTPSLLPRGDKSDPLSLLRRICYRARLRRWPPNEEAALDRLGRFVDSQCGALSANRLEEFARGEALGGPCIALEEGCTYLMGRADDCDIALRDAARISRQHARVRVEKGSIFLMDVGSANGTYVNRQRLNPGKEVRLEPGQVFVLANTHRCVVVQEGSFRLEVCDGNFDSNR